jgi:hypothetical protein
MYCKPARHNRDGKGSLTTPRKRPALAQAKVPVTDQERGDMLAMARTMKLDDLVPRALGFCPGAG